MGINSKILGVKYRVSPVVLYGKLMYQLDKTFVYESVGGLEWEKHSFHNTVEEAAHVILDLKISDEKIMKHLNIPVRIF